MTDLETRFRRLDRVRGPDLWPEIETRQPKPMSEDGMGRRFAAAAVALAVAAGGAVLVVRAFVGEKRPVERPVQPGESAPAPVDPVVDVTLPIKWPSSMVYGEGSIWVAASANDGTGAGTIYRIDPDTAQVLAEIDVPTVPAWENGGGGMTATGGSLWITGSQGSQGALLQIDTATNELADVFPLGGDFAGEVAVDQYGVWVTLFSRPSVELARVGPRTMVVDRRTSLGVDWAREILTVGGTIWVRVMGEEDELSGDARRLLFRIDPETGRIVDRVHVPGAVMNVTAGGGYIWVTASKSSGNVLARLDPITGAVSTSPSGELDYFPEFGEGGLWARGLDRSTGRLLIVRFDPTTGTIDARVVLPKRLDPIDVAVAPESVWVASYGEGVTRVELRPA